MEYIIYLLVWEGGNVLENFKVKCQIKGLHILKLGCSVIVSGIEVEYSITNSCKHNGINVALFRIKAHLYKLLQPTGTSTTAAGTVQVWSSPWPRTSSYTLSRTDRRPPSSFGRCISLNVLFIFKAAVVKST